MTVTERRITVLEEKIAPANTEKCVRVDWGRGDPVKCPVHPGRECSNCPVPERSRSVMRVSWIGSKGELQRCPP